jgi:PAS domain-containing protein
MSNLFPLITNIFVFAGFTTALVAAATTPSRRSPFFGPGMVVILSGAMGVWAFAGASHLLQYGFGSLALDVYENYLKVMFFPLLGCAAYLAGLNEQLAETRRRERVLAAEHDMLMRIVDTTPTGIAVLDPAGRIEFANDRAKELLELKENPDTGALVTSGWSCAGAPSGDEEGTFGRCLGAEAVKDARCEMIWPDGRRRPIVLNATPIVTANGDHAGTVVAVLGHPWGPARDAQAAPAAD